MAKENPMHKHLTGLIAIDKVGNKIRFYDPASMRQVHEIAAPEPCVHELAISPDRTTAYVPLYGDGIYGTNRNPNNKVMVIDLPSRSVRDVIELGEHFAPHGMVATRDGGLWVGCDLTNALLRLDPARRTIEATYKIPGKGAHFIAMLPDESKLYCSNKEGDLAVFDMARRSFTITLPMRGPGITQGNGSGSEGLAVTPDGKRVLTVDNHLSELRVIESASDREIDRVPLNMNALTNPKRSRLHRLAFSPDGGTLVVTNYASALAWIIDAQDLRRQWLVTMAKGPQGIAFAPDRRAALIGNHDSGLITRIDLEEKRADAVFDGGAGIEVLDYF
jgi:DNA-binding beta-propeller fold protein YncE